MVAPLMDAVEGRLLLEDRYFARRVLRREFTAFWVLRALSARLRRTL